MEKYINCPLWVFIIACIIGSIFCGYAIFSIIMLQLEWRDHKRKLKINPNYESEAMVKKIRKEIEQRGEHYYSGGYSSELSTDTTKDTSNWDNNNINLMTTGTF